MIYFKFHNHFLQKKTIGLSYIPNLNRKRDEAMTAKRSAPYYFIMNLILPGLAQMAIGHYWRGLIQLGICAGCFVLAACKLLVPMINNLKAAFDDTGTKFETYDLNSILIAVAVMIVVWCWSLFELPLLLHRQSVRKQNEEGKI